MVSRSSFKFSQEKRRRRGVREMKRCLAAGVAGRWLLNWASNEVDPRFRERSGIDAWPNPART